jgi:predicted transcriptional regulator
MKVPLPDAVSKKLEAALDEGEADLRAGRFVDTDTDEELDAFFEDFASPIPSSQTTDAKLAALRGAIQIGLDDFEAGRYTVIRNREELEAFFRDLD